MADFLMIVVLTLILATLYQSVSSSRLIERMAVAELQQKLLKNMSSGDANTPDAKILSDAFRNGQVKQTYVDGDLQRFWFAGTLFFNSQDSSKITLNQGVSVLTAFGEVLKKYEGDPSDLGSGLYKRVIVEGHAGRSEGDSDATWMYSLLRANSAVNILQSRSDLPGGLLEASGRGKWIASDIILRSQSETDRNRRIEIVIVYSGKRAFQYLQNSGH